MHKGSENLKPCKPGETHNPNGRPKGVRNISTVLKELLAGMDPKEDYGSPLAKELIRIAFARDSNNGEKLRAIKDILDRIEGMPLQKQELKAELENIQINFGKLDDNKS
jgi:hypothetical protein